MGVKPGDFVGVKAPRPKYYHYTFSLIGTEFTYTPRPQPGFEIQAGPVKDATWFYDVIESPGFQMLTFTQPYGFLNDDHSMPITRCKQFRLEWDKVKQTSKPDPLFCLDIYDDDIRHLRRQMQIQDDAGIDWVPL